MWLDKGMGEKQRWGYPIIGAIIGGTIVISYIWSQFYPYIMELYQLDTVAPIALAASILGFGNMLVAPVLAGFILDRFGPKVSYLIAAAFFIIGMLLLQAMTTMSDWNTAKNYWYIGSFVIGLACGTYAGTAPATVAKWFPDNFGTAIGIVNIGPGVAAIWLAPFAAYLVKNYGLSVTFITIGIIGLVVFLVLGVGLWKLPPKGWLPSGFVPKVQAGGTTTVDLTLGQTLANPKFWILFVCMLCSTLAGFLFIMNAATIIIEGLVTKAGLEQAHVVAVLIPAFMSVTAVFSAIARPIWGFLMDKIGGPWPTMKTLYLGSAIVYLVFLATYTNTTMLFIIGALVYFFFGGTSPVHGAAGPWFFGREAAGKIMGVLNMAVGIGWIIGPYLGGYLRDVTGSYQSPIIVSASLAVVALLIATIGPKFLKENTETDTIAS